MAPTPAKDAIVRNTPTRNLEAAFKPRSQRPPPPPVTSSAWAHSTCNAATGPGEEDSQRAAAQIADFQTYAAHTAKPHGSDAQEDRSRSIKPLPARPFLISPAAYTNDGDHQEGACIGAKLHIFASSHLNDARIKLKGETQSTRLFHHLPNSSILMCTTGNTEDTICLKEPI